MLFSRAWFALMRRNALYRKRHLISTLLEMTLPIAFCGILIAIKNSLGDDVETTIVEPTFPDPTTGVYRPLSFLDFITTIQAPKVCVASAQEQTDDIEFDDLLLGEFDISGLPFQAYDWQNPFVKCDNRLCTAIGEDAQPFCEYNILAVAPKTATVGQGRAQDFYDYLAAEYPVLFQEESGLPFDFDFVKFFESQAQLESYVTSTSYGKPDYPKVGLAVVWDDGASTKDYVYALRQNSTGFNVPEASRPGALTTPDTSRIFDEFSPNDRSCPIFDGAAFLGPRQGSCTGQYLYNGVITMQKLVGDFILKDSGANVQVADHGIRLVPFPTKQYEEGGFFADIARTLYDYYYTDRQGVQCCHAAFSHNFFST
jgi:hypothetical protein